MGPPKMSSEKGVTTDASRMKICRQGKGRGREREEERRRGEGSYYAFFARRTPAPLSPSSARPGRRPGCLPPPQA
jgi:hypothetical protein